MAARDAGGAAGGVSDVCGERHEGDGTCALIDQASRIIAKHESQQRRDADDKGRRPINWCFLHRISNRVEFRRTLLPKIIQKHRVRSLLPNTTCQHERDDDNNDWRPVSNAEMIRREDSERGKHLSSQSERMR